MRDWSPPRLHLAVKRWLAMKRRLAMKRWLREPLLHFLLIGGALFAVSPSFESRAGADAPSRQIRLTPDELLQVATYFQAQWRRPPTLQEFSGLVDDRVRQEVLYREALAMGLDRDDSIVKRRMAQKMQFLAEDVATQGEPDRATLEAWYARHRDRFALPGRIGFRQIYFSPDRRGEGAHGDAEKALVTLGSQPIDSTSAVALGDPFMLQEYYSDRSPEQIGKEFGAAFAQAIFLARPGAWQGPIESGFGWHVVFVHSSAPGRLPVFAEVETDARTAWLAEQKAVAWEKAYTAMRAKYTVLLPAIPDNAPGVRAAAAPAGVAAPAAR